jgi:pyridoxamine 5'-phosphate oxidase
MQSRPLASRAMLESRLAAVRAELGEDPQARPAYWSGFRLVPLAIEFWQEGAYRLHDRVRFSRPGRDAPWSRQRLYP